MLSSERLKNMESTDSCQMTKVILMEMLYINKKDDAEWTTIGEIHCTHCKDLIEQRGICIEVEDLRRPKHHQFGGYFFFHYECVKEHKNYTFAGINSRQVQTKPLKVLAQEPRDFLHNYDAYIPKGVPIQYMKNNATVFEPHLLPDSQGRDNDRTILANRESFESASIGEDTHALLEEKDRSVDNEGEALKLLQEIRDFSEKARLEEQERGYIEYNPQESNLTIEEDERRQQNE